jgi:PleD family two-component response regulator
VEDRRMAVGNAINTCYTAADETVGFASVRERILIVDANLADRERLTREFRAAGYDVAAVRTSEQALLLLRNWLSC